LTTAPTSRTSTATESFRDLGIPAELSDVLAQQGITAPFPIQSLTIADALAGRDLCGKAPTGSGKTLAFSLPVAMRVGKAAPGRPRALLLVPTRELASQVRDVLQPLLRVTGRQVATFYGGTNINSDLKRLRGRIDVAVATPGRLEDLIQRRAISLKDVDLVVLDEADRMADMGFLPVVKRLLDATRSDRQTLLFSATLDGDVDVLIRRYQRDPARHEFATSAEERGDTKHVFWPAERPDRRALTAKIVRKSGQAIVFTRTKHGADRLAKQLAKEGVRTAAIHGNRSQNQRERALAQFADGDVHALIATDVAARGIHVDDVAVVVHFDQPGSHKDYVHRSGRTGRAGSDGLVVSLVGNEELKDVRAMQRELGLPAGLHELDLELLGAGQLPDPDYATGGHAERSHQPNRPRGGSGQRRRNGGGHGKQQPRGGARQRNRQRQG
jgi:superfamily II DNA/RNA helicase